jgi:hypothetical protein
MKELTIDDRIQNIKMLKTQKQSIRSVLSNVDLTFSNAHKSVMTASKGKVIIQGHIGDIKINKIDTVSTP